jgi:hypothetical protein
MILGDFEIFGSGDIADQANNSANGSAILDLDRLIRGLPQQSIATPTYEGDGEADAGNDG